MENITIGQILAFIAIVAGAIGSITAIVKVYNIFFGNKLNKIKELEKEHELFRSDIEESKQDRKETKELLTILKESNLAIVRSQIVSKCEQYMDLECLPEYARYCLSELYKNYKALGGNHGIDNLVEKCFDLPSKKIDGRRC